MRNYFSKKVFLQRRYQYQNLVFESYHAQTQDYELRREVCENGSFAFEGIFVDGEPYGISTWWACNNQLRMQGVRYKGERVGEWVIREENVPGTEIKDYGHFELITSMPVFVE
ncbi:hypothetical protein [Hymenobacter glacieicola]|uniref:YopX protein domain-containing protein n=1 Tax=Hymenobacter glacieicola TaxID=1562124 RepID=A0ABQ1WNJ4_9BACT|nr:hypothetical protein [Hymenobacter glacieicola]GGG36070.1 hypothetical protein GCM10011378_10460 [Hymenobacter glacieicola]